MKETFERATRNNMFKVFAIFILLLSTLSTGVPMQVIEAEGGSGDSKDGHGRIGNVESEIDYERATINKQVRFGSKPGEYFIDLTVKGKDNAKIDTMDIVIPYDLSNSMENNKVPGTNRTRTDVAAEATKQFINGLLVEGKKFRIAFVPYGTSIMDGKTRSYLQNSSNQNGGNYGTNQINPYNYYVGEFTNLAKDITDKIPKSINHGNHGGTFTQQALERAGQILENQSKNTDHKVIVTITDGLPTISYNENNQVWGTGSESQTPEQMEAHRTNTINEANKLKENYRLYAIAVGLSENSPNEKEVIEGISNSADDAYFANTVQELVDALNDITTKLSNSVIDGSITDPITDEFLIESGADFTKANDEDLTDGEYFLKASDDSLLEGISINVEGKDLKIDGLNLGEGDEVTIRYKVQVDTDNLDLDPNKLYKTNGETTLTPRGDFSDEKVEFPVPEASTVPIEVSGVKTWEDYGYKENRPDELIVQLYRDIKGKETMIKEVTVTPNDDDEWTYVFEDVFLYDTAGEEIDYKIKEVIPAHYEPTYDNGNTNIVNKLKQEPEIKLVKTGISQSDQGEDVIDAGKDIDYTFTITNTGNLPLKDITLTDELAGISEFTYTTLNGAKFTGNIADLVMEPGDVLVATASYTVTQEDVEHGQVTNDAKVEGTPTVPEPNVDFDDTPVTDEASTSNPGELDPSISLTKTADKKSVAKVGDKVTYTFEITNTGNTRLTDVILIDPMLGGEIELEVDTLLPGESTTVTVDYESTQADFNAGEFLNKAEVEGTPPPAYTAVPNNPQKVTDEDNEKVTAEQKSEITLDKTADKDELVAGETITYTFTAANTGSTTLTNVTITDLLDGISDIDYLSINDEEIRDKNNITLNSGDVLTAQATYKVTQADVDYGQVKNEATVKGIDPNSKEITDTDEKVVKGNQSPDILIEKKADKEEVTEVGEEIKYTFTVTNKGNVSLKDVKITDPMLDDLGIKVELDKNTLLPGETTTGTATYTVTQADLDNGGITNVATATGTPPAYDPDNPPTDPNEPGYPPVSPPSEVEVPAKQEPALELTKEADKEKVNKAGDEITYTFTVKNAGNVTLENVKVTDPLLEKLNIEVEPNKTKLSPGESTTGTAIYTVTQEDIDKGFVKNVATASGNIPGMDPKNPNNPVSPPAEKIVQAEQNPVIELEKSTGTEKYTKVGQEIQYEFTVKNKGNVTLTDVKVNDETFKFEVGLDKTKLAPGETATGTFTYTVTREDLDNGEISNVAKAEGTPPNYDPEDPDSPEKPTYEDEVSVPAERQPSISLEKLVDRKNVYTINGGDEVTYTFIVENTGNVTLDNVVVNDPLLGGEVELEKTTLASGETTTGKARYKITKEDYDRGYVDNIATVTGTPPGYDPANPPTDPEDPTYPPEDEGEVKVKTKHPDIQLIKTSDTKKVTEVGQVVRYTFKVKNAGNVTLENIKISDEKIPTRINLPKTTLQPNETVTGYAQYVVTEEDLKQNILPNVATVSGTPTGYDEDDPNSPQPVKDNDEEIIPTEKGENAPNIQLEKISDKKQVEIGDKVTYTFKVKNTGKITLNDVTVKDPLLGENENIHLEQTTLSPGEETTGTAAYKVQEEHFEQGQLKNTAKVTGTPVGYDPDNPDSPQPVEDEDIDIIYPKGNLPPMKANIKIVLSTDTDLIIEEDQPVTYFYKVTNTGDTILEDVELIDPILGDELIVPLEKTKLLPDESTYGTGIYYATEDDVGKKKLPNRATTFGYSPMYTGERLNLEELVKDIPHEDREEQILQKIKEINDVNEKMGEAELKKRNFAGLTDRNGRITMNSYASLSNSPLQNTSMTNIHQFDHLNWIVPYDIDDEEIPSLGSSIELSKTSDTDLAEEAGQIITYIFKIKNTGEVRINNVNLNDPMLEGKIDLGKLSLEVGETKTITKEYIVTEEDLQKDEIINTAVVEGEADNDEPKEDDPVDEDEIRIPTIKGQERPAIQLEKLADKGLVTTVGEEITYTFIVTNTGGSELTGVKVDDPMLGGNVVLEKTTLAPGEFTTGTATYIVTEDDLNEPRIVNQATARGIPEGYDPANPESPEMPEDEDEAIVYSNTIPPGHAKINLLKTSKSLLIEEAGEEVTFNFKVTNTGDFALTDIEITDEMLEEAGVEEIKLGKTKLNPGESTTATAQYTVTQEDMNNGFIRNVATVTGTPPWYNPDDPNSQQKPEDEDEITVYSDANPVLDIVKTAKQSEVAKAGDKVTFEFEVTNKGNVTLENVTVDDPMLEEANVPVELQTTTLAPGESTTGKAVYTVSQEDIDRGTIRNVATATGNLLGYDPNNPTTDPGDPIYSPVSPPDEVEIGVKQEPKITLDKKSNKIKVTKPGEMVTYTFTIKNEGNVTVEDIGLNDPMLGGNVVLEHTTLAPGESMTVKETYQVTEADLQAEELINLATVSGKMAKSDSDFTSDVTIDDKDVIFTSKKAIAKILPSTATQMYSMIALGLGLLLLGFIFQVTRRRKQS